MSKLPNAVFVYGTLKKKFPNHHVLHTGKAELVGHGTTVPKFLLFNGGFPKMAHMPRVSPHLLPQYAKHLGHVWGEVWRVDDESFMACDRLEGHPRFYCREKIGVRLDGGNAVTTAWAYVIVDFPYYDVSSLIKPKDDILTWNENVREQWKDIAWRRDDDFDDVLKAERKKSEAVLRGKVLARDRKR